MNKWGHNPDQRRRLRIERLAVMEPPDDIIPIEPPTKMGDANTQRQRVKKLVQSTGRIQPKTNIENDEAPPMRWRE